MASLCDALRVPHRRIPRHSGSPIVSGEEDLFAPDLIGNGNHILRNFSEPVIAHFGRLAALVVAALIGHDDAKSCVRERPDLLTPAIPELRKTMEQNKRGAVFRSCRDSIQMPARNVEYYLFIRIDKPSG